MIRAVVFDVDGTFYRSREYVRHLRRIMDEVLAEILGIDVVEAHRRLGEVKRRLLTVSASVEALGVDRKVFYERVAERVRPCDYIPRREGLREMLGELRSMGLALGCHTNSGRKLMEKVLRCLGLRVEDFDVCLTSDDAEPKPSLQGYLKLLELLELRAGEVLYVGDRWRVEVEPAKRVGMLTALVAPEPRGNPDMYLRDVLELPGKLKPLLSR